MPTAAMVGGWVYASMLRVSPVEGGVSSVSPLGTLAYPGFPSGGCSASGSCMITHA